jgi:hypothetical protein
MIAATSTGREPHLGAELTHVVFQSICRVTRHELIMMVPAWSGRQRTQNLAIFSVRGAIAGEHWLKSGERDQLYLLLRAAA